MRRRRTARVVGAIVTLFFLALAAFVLAALKWSGASLHTDRVALARVEVQRFGGTLVSADATDSHGHAIPLRDADGVLTPRAKLRPGEKVTVDVVVRRSKTLGWLIGHERHERLTIVAPRAHVTSRWITSGSQGPVVHTDAPVVAFGDGGGPGHRHTLAEPATSFVINPKATTGTTKVSVAARSWERVGPAAKVTFFPKASHPVAVPDPAPGTNIAPASTLRLQFSTTVKSALGDTHPTLSPTVAGDWHAVNTHTIEFTPSGYGFAFGSSVTVSFPRPVSVATAGSTELTTTTELHWSVPAGSTLRLQQLLAEQGYLPYTWTPDGPDVSRTPSAQAKAAGEAPKGTFTLRYADTPKELTKQWSTGQLNEITRGAIMRFQDRHGLETDAIAGPAVWKALLADQIAGKRLNMGYSYVFVHRDTPQQLNLWHDGKVIEQSPGNTGVPAAPTQLGTFPVFEHLAVTTMSGTNPDGSKYHDPGVKWVSYFNGGDALHAFPRASYGTPQSLGCVELPEAAAKKVWPYTPIGTLVTIES